MEVRNNSGLNQSFKEWSYETWLDLRKIWGVVFIVFVDRLDVRSDGKSGILLNLVFERLKFIQ